jgi:RNA polymerase sigma factor (sigma-70 family)
MTHHHHTKLYVDAQTADRLASAEVARTVRLAASGHGNAWNALVERFSSRVRAVVRMHRLPAADVEDVVQTTWLRLVEHIERLRDPETVGAWLATTARRESLRVLTASAREQPSDDEALGDEPIAPALDRDLEAADARRLVDRALAVLSPRDAALVRLLFAEPAPSYAEISQRLGLPVGSIGPTRGRCLEQLARNAALRAHVDAPPAE